MCKGSTGKECLHHMSAPVYVDNDHPLGLQQPAEKLFLGWVNGGSKYLLFELGALPGPQRPGLHSFTPFTQIPIHLSKPR